MIRPQKNATWFGNRAITDYQAERKHPFKYLIPHKKCHFSPLSLVRMIDFLIPPHHIIFESFDVISEAPADERLIKFSDYLVDVNISQDPQFPPPLRAEHSPQLTGTTNA